MQEELASKLQVNVVNIAFQSSLQLFGQYLNFKCGEQDI